ncbi:hypothetical protein HDR60_02965 [bacterium]|nr:hypothetical protein [bacterium]
MADVVKYLDEHGLGTLIKLIKKQFNDLPSMYTIKGSAIFADDAFLALSDEEKDKVAPGASSITSAGMHQKVNGDWVKVDAFKEGDAFNVIREFHTDASFLEGAGHHIDSGVNVIVVNVGEPSDEEPTYKFDVLSGVIDTSALQTKALTNPFIDLSRMREFDNYSHLASWMSDPYAAEDPDPEQGHTGQLSDFEGAIVKVANDEDGHNNGIYLLTVTHESTSSKLTATRLGSLDVETVEGMLEYLYTSCANTPINDAKIEDIWNKA